MCSTSYSCKSKQSCLQALSIAEPSHSLRLQDKSSRVEPIFLPAILLIWSYIYTLSATVQLTSLYLWHFRGQSASAVRQEILLYMSDGFWALNH